jgi:hypothetical protein
LGSINNEVEPRIHKKAALGKTGAASILQDAQPTQWVQ